MFVVKNFVDELSRATLDHGTHAALSKLCQLYAGHGIVENMGEFLQVHIYVYTLMVILN